MKRFATAVVPALLLLLCSGGVAANPSDTDVEPLRFPREAVNDLGRIVIHAPQIEAWTDFEIVEGAAAVEASLADSDDVHLGSVRFQARTVNDLDARVVTILDRKITALSFPGTSDAVAAE